MRVCGVLLLLLAGCAHAPHPAARPYLNMTADAAGPLPALLSQTGAFADTAALVPDPALVAYELNVPFWSDGADKQRWVAVPAGERVRFSPTEAWGFPSGTVFVKHFERDGRRLETRLLVRDHGDGVFGASYQWRADGSDAELVTAGHRDSGWYFPGPDDCGKCHLPAAGGVLGVTTRQLNRAGPDGDNQLRAWTRRGLLVAPAAEDLPALPPLDDANPEAAARSYLDANCGHCHRPGGAAADFDARFGTPLDRQGLIDAPARINLGLDRARQIAPNDPWRSMVLVRMATPDATKMPPLAHERVDARGLEIVRRWITSLPGPPVVPPPAIEPRGGDFADPVRVTLAHPDAAAVIRYTLDGRPPTAMSAVYAGPLNLAVSATVRVRAYKPGHTPSVVVQETFIVGN